MKILRCDNCSKTDELPTDDDAGLVIGWLGVIECSDSENHTYSEVCSWSCLSSLAMGKALR